MANCVTCGAELHPERAEKYDYCTKPDCVKSNSKGLPMVAVGVNKAADQYVVLNERTEREMTTGRYKKRPEAPGSCALPREPGRPARRGRLLSQLPVLPPAPHPGGGARLRRTLRSSIEPWG
jgi:hypothetical protein